MARVAAAETVRETARVLDVAEEEGEGHDASPTRSPRSHAGTGSSALTRVPPQLALDAEPAVERLDPVAQAVEARAPVEVGASDAVVHDLDHRAPVDALARTTAERAEACLTTFASASEAT